MNNDHSVFVAHCDYGRRGFEALVDMAMTRADLIKRIASGDLGFGSVIRVDEYNVVEGWARDISTDIAWDVCEFLRADGEPLNDWQRDYIEQTIGLEAARAFPREMA